MFTIKRVRKLMVVKLVHSFGLYMRIPKFLCDKNQ